MSTFKRNSAKEFKNSLMYKVAAMSLATIYPQERVWALLELCAYSMQPERSLDLLLGITDFEDFRNEIPHFIPETKRESLRYFSDYFPLIDEVEYSYIEHTTINGFVKIGCENPQDKDILVEGYDTKNAMKKLGIDSKEHFNTFYKYVEVRKDSAEPKEKIGTMKLSEWKKLASKVK